MLDEILAEANEDTVTQRVTLPLDQLRADFHVRQVVVPDAGECERVFGTFVQEAYAVIAGGGRLPMERATGIARDLLSHEGRRRGKTFNSFVADSVRGYEGGIAGALDALAEGLKAEGTRFFLDEVIDRHIPLNRWEPKVQLMRELVARFGRLLPAEVRRAPAEQYAASYREILQSVFETMKESARSFRRI
jgi:hypothetical protein